MEGSNPIMFVEKSIHSMKKQNMSVHFLYNFLLDSLTYLITCFFFSYPFWLPFVKNLITLSLIPNGISDLLDAKCFFLVGNLIVLILIRESRQENSSPVSDMYNEYVARSQRSSYHKPAYNTRNENALRISIHACGEEKKKKTLEKRKEVVRVSKIEGCTGREIVKREKTRGEKEGQSYDVPREEFNKRVEAFIARVNKQRFIEAQFVDQCRG